MLLNDADLKVVRADLEQLLQDFPLAAVQQLLTCVEQGHIYGREYQIRASFSSSGPMVYGCVVGWLCYFAGCNLKDFVTHRRGGTGFGGLFLKPPSPIETFVMVVSPHDTPESKPELALLRTWLQDWIAAAEEVTIPAEVALEEALPVLC